jgi:hypothetical protein
MHFMNPVPVMQLVELIRGIATDEPTFEASEALAELGKTSAVSEDFPAFIVNRILLPMINEAVYALYEGVGSVEAIDTAMRWAPTIRWARWSWPISSAWIPACRSCRCCMRAGRQQIPPLPAAGEICRGRLARPQGRPRLLRLRGAGLNTGSDGPAFKNLYAFGRLPQDEAAPDAIGNAAPHQPRDCMAAMRRLRRVMI